MKVLRNRVVSQLHDLTHPPDGRRSEVPKVKATLKRRVVDAKESEQQIISAVWPMCLKVPHSIMVDFEQAAINALFHSYPNATTTGCFYHLSQNIYRKVQSEGLQQLYSKDADIAMATRKLAALEYVPVSRVIDTFELFVVVRAHFSKNRHS